MTHLTLAVAMAVLLACIIAGAVWRKEVLYAAIAIAGTLFILALVGVRL